SLVHQPTGAARLRRPTGTGFEQRLHVDIQRGGLERVALAVRLGLDEQLTDALDALLAGGRGARRRTGLATTRGSLGTQTGDADTLRRLLHLGQLVALLTQVGQFVVQLADLLGLRHGVARDALHPGQVHVGAGLVEDGRQLPRPILDLAFQLLESREFHAHRALLIILRNRTYS